MYLIVNSKVNISTIAFQVKVVIGIEVKLIVVSSMSSYVYLIIEYLKLRFDFSNYHEVYLLEVNLAIFDFFEMVNFEF